MMTGPRLVIVTSDIKAARTTGSDERPVWYDRRTNMRLHASYSARSWYLRLLKELVDHGEAYAYTSSLKTALDLPKALNEIANVLGVRIEYVTCSPQSMPLSIQASVRNSKRWGNAMYSELPEIMVEQA